MRSLTLAACCALSAAFALSACSGSSASCQTSADCPANSVCSEGQCLIAHGSSGSSAASSTGRAAGGSTGTAGASTGGSSSGSGATGTHGSGASAGTTGGESSGGATSAGTTGASATGGCSPGVACTPANICDDGAVDCSTGTPRCVDQGTANDAQTGVSCGPNASCEGTQCLSPDWPIMPNQGGGVLANPNLIILTYSDDPNAASIQGDGAWVADGGYLPLVAAQYGVGNGTVQFVDLGPSSGAPTGTTTNPDAFPSYLQSLLSANTIPPYAPENLYILYLPASWADTSTFCQSYGGYHTYFQEADGDAPVYAIIPNCLGTQAGALQQIEYAATHEIVEGSTDPYADAWTFAPGSPWYYLGGELADMCSYDSEYLSPGGTYVAPLIWSNEQAQAGGIPCQPWTPGTTFLSLAAPTTMAVAMPGSGAQVTVTGWASAPSSSWGILPEDNPVGWAQFATSPTLSSQTVSAGQQIEVRLQVPSTALGGQSGAVWLICQDPSSGDFLGSAMVGVTAGCVATASCVEPTTICYPDGGAVDYCGTDVCDTPFSPCSAQGKNDGTCVPYAPGFDVCNQAGTLPAGSTGCLTERTGDGGVAGFCESGSYCFGIETNTCLALCGVDAGAGCAAGDDCVPLAESFGVCGADCTSGETCPAGQTCYSTGLDGQSACLP